MPEFESLAHRWHEVVAQMANLGPMRPGSLCAQKVKYRAKDGSEKFNGPYPILTFKDKGQKTRTIRLHDGEETELVEKQIANFREFKRLSQELTRIGREMADLEMAGKSDAKKNSSSASKPNRKGKRKRSSSA